MSPLIKKKKTTVSAVSFFLSQYIQSDMMATIPTAFTVAKSEACRVNTITGDNRLNPGADHKRVEAPRARAGMSLVGLGCGGHTATAEALEAVIKCKIQNKQTNKHKTTTTKTTLSYPRWNYQTARCTNHH